jgi:competence protein ComEC
LKKSPKFQALARKLSPVSKTNWRYKPGLLFWCGLSSGLVSFAFLRVGSWQQWFFSCLLCLVAIVFAWLKFKHPWLIISCLLVLGSFQFNQLGDLQQNQPLLIYPDEIAVEDNFMRGLAHQNGVKVRVYGQADQRTQRMLKKGAVCLPTWEGEISPIAPPRNRGQFDYQRYSLGQNIKTQVKLSNAQILAVNYPWPHRLKFNLQQYLQKLPNYLRFFASELLLAKADDELAVKDNYRQLGVVHLLSLSGLHVSLYCLLISAVGYRLHFTEEEVTGVCVCWLAAGIFLSGWQPGFVRAGISYGLKKISRFRRWTLPACDLLGLTLCLHLLLQPRLFLNVGAQLSYLLTWGLQLVEQLPKWQRGICLNLLIAPVLLANFYGLNFLTCLFNLMIVPYFNYWVMPLTFLGLLPFLMPWCEWLLAGSEALLAELAKTQLGWLAFGQINWWQTALLTGLTVYWLLWQLPVKHKYWRWPWLLYVLCFLNLHFPVNGQVTFIDVGQGDSILLTTPGRRKAYLIDTGGRLNFGKRKKRSAQVLQTTLPYLKAQGIAKLDGVFLSHQDADHIGDLRELLKAIPVDHMYFGAGLDKNPAFRRKLVGLHSSTQLHPLLAGDHLQLSKELQMQVLWPRKPGPGSNEDSLCLLAKFPHRTWLFTGDLDQAHERVLANSGVAADYLKLGHHGSKTASDPQFLKTVHPRRVFISAGVNNRYGHPHPETIKTLQQLGLSADNTAECGMISWTYSAFQQDKFSYQLKEPTS